MRWRLLIEEFGPELIYIKGENNIVADALSRMDLSEENVSAAAFATDDDEEFPDTYSLTYAELRSYQKDEKWLQDKLLKETR